MSTKISVKFLWVSPSCRYIVRFRKNAPVNISTKPYAWVSWIPNVLAKNYKRSLPCSQLPESHFHLFFMSFDTRLHSFLQQHVIIVDRQCFHKFFFFSKAAVASIPASQLISLAFMKFYAQLISSQRPTGATFFCRFSAISLSINPHWGVTAAVKKNNSYYKWVPFVCSCMVSYLAS